jgi:hypothetical protein
VIEKELDHDDPALAASLRRGRPPSSVRRDMPFWAVQLWVLVVLLSALAIHPLLYPLGVFGIGLLTAAIVLPWLVNAARSAQARPTVADVDRSG